MAKYVVSSLTILYVFLQWSVPSALFSQQWQGEPLQPDDAGLEQLALLQEYLDWRQAHPLEINSARLEEWLALPWIDETLAAAMVNHKKKRSDGYASTADLLAVPGMTPSLHAQIAPFITCRKEKAAAAYTLQGRHRWQWLPRSRGYEEGVYPGTPRHHYQRLQWTYGTHCAAGVLLEKDAGETGRVDLGRAYLQWKFARARGEMIGGHYGVHFGRGLVFPRHDGWGSGYDPIEEARPKPVLLRPALTAAENGQGNGLALRWCAGAWSAIAFARQPRWDATQQDGYVTTIQWSGLHRTPAERGRRQVLGANTCGTVVSWRPGAHFNAGIAWHQAHYAPAFRFSGENLDRHVFHGDLNGNASLYLEAQQHGFHCFSEFAVSRNRGRAYDMGLLLRLAAVELLIQQYRQEPAYQPIPGATTPERKAETGWGVAWQWRKRPAIRLSFYYRFSRALWPASRTPLPSAPRQEAGVIFQHAPFSAVTGFYRLRFIGQEVAKTCQDAWNNSVKRWGRQHQWAVTGNWEWQAHSRLIFRTRVENRFLQTTAAGLPALSLADSTGWLLYQQMNLALPRKLTMVLRLTLFDALAYVNRLYVYENDLPGAYTLAMLYGRGTRLFALLRYQLSPSIQVSGRWESTRYDHADTISSGWDEISAPIRREVGLQIDWRLGGR